jgi:hypothetical protein
MEANIRRLRNGKKSRQIALYIPSAYIEKTAIPVPLATASASRR